MSDERPTPPFVARTIHRLSVPIILLWLALTALVTIGVPSLEQVEKERSVSMSPQGAPSITAMKRMGDDFKESNTDSVAMLLLESQQPLGEDAHNYYARLLHKFADDPKHVQHIQDLWSDPLTAAAAQSADGRAAYAQLKLAGNQGTGLANESADAVRSIVDKTPPPDGVKVYVTGPAALIADMNHAGQKTVIKITAVSIAVIFTMLLFVYRSVVIVILLLLMVGVELLAARGIVAYLGYHQILGLSTFAVNMLVSLGIAAGTDYGIFFIGRYQEARQAGEDRLTAYYATYRSVAKVVLASGLTIAGAVFCLTFTRMPYFQTMGLPCAVGMLVAVAIALTLVPAVLAIGSRFDAFDPKRRLTVGGWRRIGTSIVRWPAPVFIAACAVAAVGLLALPGYRSNFHDRVYLPKNVPTNLGYAAAMRHFPVGRMLPEVVLIEADHDMRNPADLLVLDRLAKGVLAVPGVATVQSVTRPTGAPIPHTSLPFRISAFNAGMLLNAAYQKDAVNDLLNQANELGRMAGHLQRLSVLIKQLADRIQDMATATHGIQEVTADLRDHIEDFEDFWRPVRTYFYWEKHCYDIPLCFSLRSIYDTIDTADAVNDKLIELVGDLNKMATLMPQLAAQLPPIVDNMYGMQRLLLTMHSTMSGVIGQMDENSKSPSAMGQAFDAAKDDDSFYLPPDAMQTEAFKRIMALFLSPDGKSARMTVSDRGDPATPEGIALVDQIKTAAEEALKTTPLANAGIYVTGASATYKDLQDGSNYDLLIAGVASLCLIFIIMLIMTRSFNAAVVIVGTVALSLGASFGLSVLLWQYILRLDLHWIVLPMSVIILLAVGSDYNLLLVSRLKEEIHAGINTGIIRAMGGTGKVVTSAGLVFAFTMASMVVSDLRVIGQVGTTIGLGLLFDTLIVRAFMTPATAALLGRWFWWPLAIRPRPASYLLRPVGSRPLVRSTFLTSRTS